MPTRYGSVLAVLGGTLVTAALLAGCATGGPAGPVTPPPDGGSESPAEVEVSAAWLDGGSMVAVLLEGSSTCVPLVDASEYEEGVLAVSLIEPDGPCTRDLVLRGVPVPLPAGVDPADALQVEVTGEGYAGTAELAGVPGLTPGGGLEGGQPSAGWATPDSFALLTWGSSSCPPQLADAVVAAPGQIAATFADPPADRACTADFGPRVTVVTVAEAGAAYEAVLSGDGLESVRIPIAGTP
ncbi:hypothetical protein ACTU3I_00825 [Microbacterium sp. RD1]|uniref:hypothetical protein n=1 Tax=Microbacterium sp. RD1 TaxID=3457313 RepID=UPI003FA525DD